MVTYKEAQAVVDTIVDTFKQDEANLDTQALANASAYIGQDVQIRDYVLGRMGENTPEANILLLTLIRAMGDNANLRSLFAVALYESGETDLALSLLDLAHDIDPDNTMVTLLTRVIKAGWSVSAFGRMREELHPKVVAHLTEIADEELGSN